MYLCSEFSIRNLDICAFIYGKKGLLRRSTAGLMLCLLVLLSACSTTKFVPEDKYLLNKMKVVIDDRKEVTNITESRLKDYVRQKPNSEIFGFWKMQLNLYSLSGPDTTKWINRALRKMGEAPEIFDEQLAAVSMSQVQLAMQNKGYFNARVDTIMSIKKRKLKLTYNVHAGQPYVLRNYQVKLQTASDSVNLSDLTDYATDKRKTQIQRGMCFDSDILEAERERITHSMRNAGYYYFEKSLLEYEADSSFGNNTVEAILRLPEHVENAPYDALSRIFRTYRISQVDYHMEGDKPWLRQRVLNRNNYLRVGEVYDQRQLDRTYAALNALGPVKYVDIAFRPAGDSLLACDITLSKTKLNSVSLEMEGTYSAGDWGVAGGVGYSNRNLFRGAEEFTLNANASYEWRGRGGRAIEAKAEAGIQFTNAPRITIGYQYQNRPDEFTRTVAQAGVSYTYRPYNSRWQHRFNLLDISYIYLPWISQEFSDYFLQDKNILKYSYEDHFILSWAYSGSYTSKRQNQPLRNYLNLNYSVETAGNLLYGISKLFNLPQDPDDGAYRIFNIRFAQYAKGDINVAYYQIFNEKHRLVYHAALGVTYPYGNASSVPFEKRYYAGGANSVRGWKMRSLGPGSYVGNDVRIDYNNQAGDIRLDLNLEYRWKVWDILNLAAFTDAGNIWTIREYESQPYGAFHWNEFYKQIAWAYGVGVRLDFSFFVFRVDFGVKLYDPSRLYTDGKVWRTVPNGLGWKDDMAFHFAIGYPF